MTTCRWIAPLLLLACSLHAGAKDGLLLYVPFDKDAMPAVANGNDQPLYNRQTQVKPGHVGNAVSVTRGATQLIYDGPGNAYTAAGTASFFWMPEDDPAKGSALILDLSPFERINYNRLMRLSYGGGKFSVYFTAGHRGAVSPTSGVVQVKAGEWHHVAMTWDQSRGLAVYFDGRKVLEYNNPWIYDGHFNAIVLGQTARADFRPDMATFSQSFDELRIYDRWLDDTALAALARGEEPSLAELDAAPLLDLRRRVLQMHGTDDDQLPELKVGGDGLGLRQAGIVTAKDVGRTTWRAFDGERARRWPGGAGYADAGQELRVVMDGRQTFDIVQLYAVGRLALASGTGEPFLLLNLTDPAYYRRVLSKPVTADNLVVARTEFANAGGTMQRTGGIYEMVLLERTDYGPPTGQDWQTLRLAPMAEGHASEAMALIRRTFYSTDHQALAAGERAGAGTAALPAMRTIHIVGPAKTERQGLGAVAIDLALTRGVPSLLHVEVADPLTPQKFLTAADIRLTGGPGRVRLLLDHRDIVLPEGVSPRLSLTFSQDVQIDLASSSISYHWMTVDQAFRQHRVDQIARAKDVFQEISEARSWAYWRALHAVGLLRNIIHELYSIDPQDQVLISYWHWINPGLQKAMVDLPPVPQGVHPWAVYLDASIEMLKKVPYWWIDHRENQYGEFGANDGINDDTDLVMDWWAMHLMRGPDEKLFNSLKRVADRSWTRIMRESGLGHHTDALHHYEDGINAQCHMALMDYGNPVYVERLMATARHYKDLMGVNQAGHLHFYDDRYGYAQSKTEPGKFEAAIDKSGTQRDEGYNALTLQPGILLGWYNGNAYCILESTAIGGRWLMRPG